MIVTHVFPEFQSQHGFLRAKVCVANDLAENINIGSTVNHLIIAGTIR